MRQVTAPLFALGVLATKRQLGQLNLFTHLFYLLDGSRVSPAA